MDITKIQQARIGLGVSIFILITILYVVFSVNKKNATASENARHSAQVILKIEELYSEINEIESAQRGYIITRNAIFLKPYRSSKISLLTKISELKELVKDNAVQEQNVQELGKLMQYRLIILKENIEDEHPGTDRFLIGNLAMTRVLLKINVIKEVEENLMRERAEASITWANKSTTAVIVSVVFVSLLILIAYMILINEYKIKVGVEKQLLGFQHQLKDKIEKLDESNKELEQFAYVASHDLQEPLRKIITFNDRIHQKFSENISDEMKDYLQRTSNAASRMRVLIDDLLSYSRVSRNDFEKAIVQLEQVFSIIKDNFEVTIQSRNVTFIHHNKLPKILGDKTQMIQLFQNLISNAIKFTPADVAPVIDIFCKVVDKTKIPKEFTPPVYDSYYMITIKDNGIGFQDNETEKIFVIFQRLHGRSEYEGTGIGLSISKKIAENHQGYIKAQSNKGEPGASFSVYLPMPTKS